MGQTLPRGNQSLHQAKHSKFHHVSYPVSLLQNSPQTMIVQLPCDETSYKKWQNDLKLYQNHLQNKKYLLLPQHHEYNNGGMCSQSGIVKITYPKLPYVLEDEIQEIKNKKNTFSQAEIWKLLYVLVQAKKEYLDFAKSFSFELGNVNPKHILLNEHNEIKLANPLSWPNYIDGYKNAVLKDPAYLSPEDLKLLDLGALNNYANDRSEDFSIGITLLSVGLVENLESLYNFNKPEFKTKLFEEKLTLWKTTLYYSEILRCTVLAFLETDPANRLTFNEARQFLKPHVGNIQNSRPLVISSVNSKIQKKVDKLMKQLPQLLKHRFENSSPEIERQVKGPKSKSLTKEQIKKINQTQLQKHNVQVQKNQNSQHFSTTQTIKTQKSVQNLPIGVEFQIGKAIQQIVPPPSPQSATFLPGSNQTVITGPTIHSATLLPTTIRPSVIQTQNPIQPSITRVKSQTRFTYSNRPLDNFSPSKFVINSQNGTVSQQPIIQDQKTVDLKQVQETNTFFQPTNVTVYQRIEKKSPEPQQIINSINQKVQETSIVVSKDYMLQPKKPSNNTVLSPAQKQAQEIAQRLVKQGLKHTDSEIHEIQIPQSNRESASTEINKLEFLEVANFVAFRPQNHIKSGNYHTYEEVSVNADFGIVWNQFLNLIHRPETYFEELQQKITVTEETIEIPPGKVRIESNREEGKVRMENVSSKCTGDILGGVSKKSAEEVQVWFNSSYKYKDEPFPTSEYFLKGLLKLKEKVEKKSE